MEAGAVPSIRQVVWVVISPRECSRQNSVKFRPDRRTQSRKSLAAQGTAATLGSDCSTDSTEGGIRTKTVSQKNMRALILAITFGGLIFPLGGCHHLDATSGPQVSAHFDWGFLKFSEVRAFRINWSDEDAFDGLVGEKNKLNPTRFPTDGVLLTSLQVERLQEAVTGAHSEHLVAACYNPHHSFAFYDSAGQIVGHIDICFLCWNYRSNPPGFAKTWNLAELSGLLTELGIPLRNEKWTTMRCSEPDVASWFAILASRVPGP